MKISLMWLLLLPVAVYCSQTYPPDQKWVTGRALVNFKDVVGEIQTTIPSNGQLAIGRSDVDALFQRYEVKAMYRISPDGTLAKMNPAPDMYRLVALDFPEKYDVLEVCRAFEALAEVVYAEPDLLRPTYSTIPNDERWNQQWDKRLMSLDVAWDYSHGSREILAIAVDNGFWWPHPDAYDNLWVNPGEDIDGDHVAYTEDYPGDPEDLNGVDDDGNGYVDDFIGWDFIDNIGGCDPREDCDNQDNETKCIDNHGTHTLGAIGAVGNNEIGVAGCNWQITIMASRAGYLPNGGTGVIVSSAAVATMNWAVAHGVKIINMSFGSGAFNNGENNAIQAAWSNGALLCGASGNDGVNSLHYPAGCNNVVSVGSVNQSDIVSDFSNYGTWVDCYAPGEGTQSLSIDSGYSNEQGTSMSSPNAAGVFALIWSIFPDLSNAQLRDLVLLDNCVDISALNPDYDPAELGFGRIDAAKVLASLLPNLSVEELSIVGDNDGDARIEQGETGELRLTVSNQEGWFTASGVNVVVTTSDPNLTISNGTFTIGSLGGGQTTELTNPNAHITCSNNVPYAYTASLNVRFDLEANISLNRTVTLRVGRARTLVVEDDNGGNFGEFFSAALANEQFNYDDYSTTLDGPITSTELSHYEDVIWVCGNENTNTLTQGDRDALQTFLDTGNHLLFASQGADEDLDLRNSSFYADYLHASSGGASGGPQISGVDGDQISDGQTLLIIGGDCAHNNVSPSVLNAVNGGVVFFTYNSNSLGGAVRYENSTYKTAYFGFAIEAACGLQSTTHHSIVIRRTMEWFGATSGVDEEPSSIPIDFTVSPAYPNPFNPEASVQIELAHNARVRATMHDVLGRQVELIADRDVSAGTHTIRVDGANLPSGSYWLNISVDNQSNVQRIILLK